MDNKDIVEAVREWQQTESMHPLTCGNDSTHALLEPREGPSGVVLFCPDCEHVQEVPSIVHAAWRDGSLDSHKKAVAAMQASLGTIEIHPMWLSVEEDLMKRIAGLIEGPNGHGPFTSQTSSTSGERKWQLDSGNNYWAYLAEGKLHLTSRYGGEKFRVLVDFVRVWLGKVV